MHTRVHETKHTRRDFNCFVPPFEIGKLNRQIMEAEDQQVRNYLLCLNQLYAAERIFRCTVQRHQVLLQDGMGLVVAALR